MPSPAPREPGPRHAARPDATPWVALAPRHRATAVADLPTERFARQLTGLPEGDAVPSHRTGGIGTGALGWLLLLGGVLGVLVSTVRGAENSGLLDLVPLCGPGPALGCEPAPTAAWESVAALVGVAGFAVAATIGLVVLSGVALPRRTWLGLLLALAAGTLVAHLLVLRTAVAADAFCTYCLLALAVAVPMLTTTAAHVLRAARAARVLVERPLLVAALWLLAVAAFLYSGVGPAAPDAPDLPGAVGAVALVSAATVAGAWTAGRFADRMGLWLSVASAMMLVTALTDIVPDVWHESEETGVPLWLPGIALVGAFLLVTVLTRGGDGHGHGHGAPDGGDGAARSAMGGAGAAAALTLHRVVEGATLALTPSIAVLAALLVHSASEGLALGALLHHVRRHLNTWLAISAAGPVLGLVVATVSPLPDAAVPVLLALVGGVLLRTALLGLRLAVAKRRSGELLGWHVAAAGAAAAALAVLTLATH